MEHQVLDQEREAEEEPCEPPEAEPQPEPCAAPEVEPRPGAKGRTWHRARTAVALVLCVALAVGGYLVVKVGQLQRQLEALQENAVSKSTIRDLAARYGLTTTFLQQMFPREYVYVGEYGITIAPIDEALTLNDYDWSGLREEDGRYQYTAPDGTQALVGVDVSTYNGDIDWTAVKGDGISFAMIRLGFRGYGESGKLVLDDKFLANIQGATQAGLDVGVYFFSQAITVDEAEEEAEYVIQALEDYSITYPVVFDLEKIGYDTARTDDLSVETATQITQAFCQRVAQAGYRPMIYGNVAWLMDRIDLTQLTQYDRWLAQYQTSPTFPYQFSMWQYGNQGTVAGIPGSVDMNLLLTPFSQDN